ncbi:MAG: tRNA modification GTPase [Phycisphaerales bacterium]
MNAPESILAAATGAHAAPRAMIRVSGNGTHELAGRLFAAPLPWPGLCAARLKLTDAMGVPVMVIAYAGPRSYTGEDAMEILVAGGVELVRRVEARILELGHDLGIRRAEPGEFSARAYHAGKLTLDQAEGVAAVIAAGSREELDSARRVLSGSAGATYLAWADELTTLAALVEAGIDFTDQEDVVAIEPSELRRRTGVIGTELDRALGARAGAERSGQAVRIALYGRPNAGKSTLFNALLGRRRAVVSPVAGTTRDALAEALELRGSAGRRIDATLIDLAGLDEAPRDVLDSMGREHAAEALAHADIALWCDETGRFDAAAQFPPTARVLRLRTKADLAQRHTDQPGSLALCALDGWGLDALRDQLFDAAWHAAGRAGDMDLLPRHREALEGCRLRLTELITLLDTDTTAGTRRPELVASLLRDAIDALSSLTGRVERDDVIGRVFATFCVGK